MTSKDASLYGIQRPRRLGGGRELTSSTSLSFSSQLSSLINASNANTTSKPTTSRSSKTATQKDDIFRAHKRPPPSKRVKTKHDDSDETAVLAQKHTTAGERLDGDIWERSKRKMEEKARLYAAMKRGDVEDSEEKYAVDFDRKWAEAQHDARDDDDIDDDDDDDDDETDAKDREVIEYIDEFGRTRTGTRADAGAVERRRRGQEELASDRFTARPSVPANVIRGDAIQHQAFNPDEPVAAQMEALARKRDKSLTPPPDEHFDARREVREKGTGFFQFSADVNERRTQMENLEAERAETEKKRLEREERANAQKRRLEERWKKIHENRSKRKADDFLDSLGLEMSGRDGGNTSTELTESIERSVREEEGEDT